MENTNIEICVNRYILIISSALLMINAIYSVIKIIRKRCCYKNIKNVVINNV